eukprot:3949689-Prymnesium_polylepis.1
MKASGGSMAQPSSAILTTCAASSSAIARLRSGASRAPPRYFAQSLWAGVYGLSLVDSAAAFTAASPSLDASALAAVAFTLSCAGTAAVAPKGPALSSLNSWSFSASGGPQHHRIHEATVEKCRMESSVE